MIFKHKHVHGSDICLSNTQVWEISKSQDTLGSKNTEAPPLANCLMLIVSDISIFINLQHISVYDISNEVTLLSFVLC